MRHGVEGWEVEQVMPQEMAPYNMVGSQVNAAVGQRDLEHQYCRSAGLVLRAYFAHTTGSQSPIGRRLSCLRRVGVLLPFPRETLLSQTGLFCCRIAVNLHDSHSQ